MNINNQLRTHGKIGQQVAANNSRDYGKYNLYEKDDDYSKFDLDKMIEELAEELEGGDDENTLKTEITGTGSAGVYTSKLDYVPSQKGKKPKSLEETDFEMEDGEDWEEDGDVDEITGSASAGVYVTKAQFQKPKDFKKQKPAIRGGMTIEPNRNLKDPPKLHGQVGFKILSKSNMNESLDPKKIFDKNTKRAIVEYATKNGQDVQFVTKSIIKKLVKEGVLNHLLKERSFLNYDDVEYIVEDKKSGIKHDGYMHKEITNTYDDESGIFPDGDNKPSTVVNYKSLGKMKVGDLFDKKDHDKQMSAVTNGGVGNWGEFDVEPDDERKKEMTQNTRGKEQKELKNKLEDISKRTKEFKKKRRKVYNIYNNEINEQIVDGGYNERLKELRKENGFFPQTTMIEIRNKNFKNPDMDTQLFYELAANNEANGNPIFEPTIRQFQTYKNKKLSEVGDPTQIRFYFDGMNTSEKREKAKFLRDAVMRTNKALSEEIN